MLIQSKLDDIILILKETGCRVSEVLNIKHSDIINGQQAIIRGLKGSSDRLIMLSIPIYSFHEAIIFERPPFININRFQVYRYCKSKGYSINIKGKIRRAVTHSFRYQFISMIFNKSQSKKTAQEVIGHKVRNTTEGYLSQLSQYYKYKR